MSPYTFDIFLNDYSCVSNYSSGLVIIKSYIVVCSANEISFASVPDDPVSQHASSCIRLHGLVVEAHGSFP